MQDERGIGEQCWWAKGKKNECRVVESWTGGDGYPVFVDNPEARSRVDFGTSHEGSRPSGDGYGRPSVESLLRTRVAAAGSAHAVPIITEHGLPARDAARDSQQQNQDIAHLNVKSPHHTPSESLASSESNRSVYTQESIGISSVRSSFLTPPSCLALHASQPQDSTLPATLPLHASELNW